MGVRLEGYPQSTLPLHHHAVQEPRRQNNGHEAPVLDVLLRVLGIQRQILRHLTGKGGVSLQSNADAVLLGRQLHNA